MLATACPNGNGNLRPVYSIANDPQNGLQMIDNGDHLWLGIIYSRGSFAVRTVVYSLHVHVGAV